jgi:hypothetical protein
MADPTGTVGALHTDKESDLALVATGGPKFVARLQQLADATNRLEQTAAKAGIGNNIEGALRQAEAKLADAEAQNQKAHKALAAAQSRAAATIEQADKDASVMVEAALVAAAKVEAEADQMRKTADAYAKRTRDEIDAVERSIVIEREAKAKLAVTEDKIRRFDAELRAIIREWAHVS